MKTLRNLPCIAALAAAALFGGGNASAQSRAAEITTAHAGLAARDIDTSGSTSTGELGLNAGATIPLGDWFAASLSASYSNATVRTREVLVDAGGTITGARPSCDIDSSGGSAGLFFRRPSLGRVGASYGIGRLSSDCGDVGEFLASGTEDLDTEHYRVYGEAYLWDFTLGASFTSTEPDGGEKFETTVVSATWYPIESLRITASGNDLYDRNGYGIVIEHQPDFMGDALGVYLGYESSDESPRTGIISFGFAYHFGPRVPLQTRDRQYR
jgi:hypothetical protein